MDGRRLIGALVLLVAVSGSACGWHDAGHAILAKAALMALPDEVPPFFRSGGREIAHHAYDPDVSKGQKTAPYVRAVERPEHYLDLEFLKGEPLPRYRYEYLALCYKLNLKPEEVGVLPYAIAEWTQRLAVAFAEHRSWPDNPMIQQKCFVYAGFLAHYAGDMCQPLHLTIHHHGRAKPDGSSPWGKIHGQVDWLVEMLELDPAELARGAEVPRIEGDLMDAILSVFGDGFGLVDRVFALEDKLPSDGESPDQVDPEVVAFTRDRAGAAVAFTASLYHYAWTLSGGMKTSGWADRARTDAE